MRGGGGGGRQHVHQLDAAVDRPHRANQQRNRGRDADRQFCDSADLAVREQLARLKHLIDVADARARTEGGQVQVGLQALLFNREPSGRRFFERQHLVAAHRAAHHEHRMHAQAVLQQHQCGHTRLDSFMLRHAGRARIQAGALHVARFRHREAANQLVADLVFDVMRRAEGVRIAAPFGAAALDRVGPPIEAEHEARALVGRQGFRDVHHGVTSTGRP
ncbi:hypothetical protein [Burkholderia vietnamiensis]|uniref:hypothetical protein n=1 Tax=Burkholderia vietnamiensis TaxID=60552 RepID=UPI00313305BA